MKKILLLFAAAVVGVSMTSCNSDSDPYEQLLGSLESNFTGTYFVDAYGTRLTAEAGYKFPELATSQSRALALVGFTYPDGMERVKGEGKTMAIRPDLSYSALFDTKIASEYESSTYDDPIIMLGGESEEHNKSLATICNFLYYNIFAEEYTKDNKDLEWSWEVEVSPEIEEGEKNEIINLYLKFYVNEVEGKDHSGIDGRSIAVDLTSVPGYLDGFDENKTYTIKLHYDAYKVNGIEQYGNGIRIDYDREIIEQKFETCEWNYSKPYASVN